MMHHFRLAICLSSLPIVVACSNGSHLLSPTAPGAGGSTVASINGTPGAGTGQTTASVRLNTFSAGAPALSGHVEGEGTVSSLVTGTTCPALSFVVEGFTIKVTASTTFAGGTCTDITAGVKLGVKGDVTPDGSVTASSIAVKKDNATKFVEGDGTVSSLVTGTSCPALSFMVEAHLIKTSASTTFDAGACLDIKAGSKVTIQGTLQSDGSVNAAHLVLKGDHPTEVEGETVIASLVAGTSCPTLSFIVEGHTVNTTPTTVYNGGTCIDAKAGVRVQVKGLMTSDGSVTATAITFKTGEGPKTVDGDGKVSSVSGTCPTLQFVVQGFTVKTDATTQFVNGLCSAVAVGKQVEVKGSMLTGVVQASLVRFETEDR